MRVSPDWRTLIDASRRLELGADDEVLLCPSGIGEAVTDPIREHLAVGADDRAKCGTSGRSPDKILK